MIMGNEVRDINERTDRAQANRLQKLLQPFRRRAVLNALDMTTDKHRTSFFIIDRDIDFGFERTLNRLCVNRLQCTQTGSGQITGNAVKSRAIRAVWRKRNFNDGIIKTENFGHRRADFVFFIDFDNAVMFIGNTHLLFGDQHAATFNTANFGFFQCDIQTRDIRPFGCENALHTCARIRGAANNLLNTVICCLHRTNSQLIRIRMRLGIFDISDLKRRKIGSLIGDFLNLEADRSQFFINFRKTSIGVQRLFEPIQREFHGLFHPYSRLQRHF